jgi:hypothetical protein
VVVIVVAMMAIVAAVVVMVWPTGHGEPGKHTLQPPPAPERMDTQTPPVTPKINAPTPGPHASAPAAPAPDSSDASASDQVADDDDLATGDATGSPRPAPARRGHRALSLNAGGMLQITMAARLCRKLVRCGTTDETMKSMCEQIASMGVSADPPAGCPAAERCLQHIDAMGCTSQPDALQVGMLMMQFSDCVNAMRC